MADRGSLTEGARLSLRFDLDRPRSSVPAGPLRGIMPRPVSVRAPAGPVQSPQAKPAQPGGLVRPAPGAARPAAQQTARTGRAAYGGRGEPPPPGSGWDAFLDWAAFGGFDSSEDRSLAFQAWSGALAPVDAG